MTAGRWDKPDPADPGQTLAQSLYRQFSFHEGSAWIWIGVGVVIGWIVVLNVATTLALMLLDGAWSLDFAYPAWMTLQLSEMLPPPLTAPVWACAKKQGAACKCNHPCFVKKSLLHVLSGPTLQNHESCGYCNCWKFCVSRVLDHAGSEWQKEAVLLCLHLMHSSRVPIGFD